MRHIKFVLPKTINDFKKKKEENKNIICQKAEEIIKKSTPNVEVFFYRNKTVYVRCFDVASANELSLNQAKLINKINRFLGRETINKLAIRIN